MNVLERVEMRRGTVKRRKDKIPDGPQGKYLTDGLNKEQRVDPFRRRVSPPSKRQLGDQG